MIRKGELANQRLALESKGSRVSINAMKRPHTLAPLLRSLPLFRWSVPPLIIFTQGISMLTAADLSPTADDLKSFVRVSPRDNRYFELSNGHSYVPIGLNLIAPDGLLARAKPMVATDGRLVWQARGQRRQLCSHLAQFGLLGSRARTFRQI